jgi:exonuclease SbcD
VRDPRLDYVALGHIHKPQNLNTDKKARGGSAHPPVIYPGSIERVDFGEAGDDKFYVIAHVKKGKTRVEWRRLEGVRPFFDRQLRLESRENLTEQLKAALPSPEEMESAYVRLVLEYPRDWEAEIDEAALLTYTAGCMQFHLVKRPQVENRIRLPEDQAIGSLAPLELLEKYWQAAHTPAGEAEALGKLAGEIIREVEGLPGDQ